MTNQAKRCPWSGYECPKAECPTCETCIQYTESKAKLNAEIEAGVKAVYDLYSPSAQHRKNILGAR